MRMNNGTVACVRELKYLGVVIDKGFTFGVHLRILKVTVLFVSLHRNVMVV